jgi:hypothetical protein
MHWGAIDALAPIPFRDDCCLGMGDLGSWTINALEEARICLETWVSKGIEEGADEKRKGKK